MPGYLYLSGFCLLISNELPALLTPLALQKGFWGVFSPKTAIFCRFSQPGLDLPEMEQS